MLTIIQAVSKSECNTISELANTIWKEHYTPIIGVDQVNYMLEKFQSSEVIFKQIQNEQPYYVIKNKDLEIGYFCIYPNNGKLFLSKLYILKKYRAKGVGRFAFDFVQNKAREFALDTIYLTVNINNTRAIKSYEKMGFVIVGPIKADIGAGYVMDDYQMVKKLTKFTSQF